MKTIRVKSRVIAREPGQPERHGVVTEILALDDGSVVYDIMCDDGRTKLFALPARYVFKEDA